MFQESGWCHALGYSALWCRPSGIRFACLRRRQLRGWRPISMTCCLPASNGWTMPIWRGTSRCWVRISWSPGLRAGPGPGSRLARPGLSSTIWDLTFTSRTVFTDRRAFAHAVPRSRHCRTPTWEIVILALHPGRMAKVYFFDLASLGFTISVNRWDTPRNNASLLAGRCQSGH